MEQQKWPDFVTEEEEHGRTPEARPGRTGWETVIFELDDADLQDWESSVFSTAALAP
jgi:hypothetical protein